ncbi:MAG: VWA domain-containing protein [Chloroflexi bacterium]|nr:VWA domain-containing protein [Chloroflexota bacterium]
MDVSRNWYAVLGVAPGATQEDIREAYRVAARRLHPDANRNEGADYLFRDIAAAYAVLGNSSQRAAYDSAREHFKDDPGYFSLRVTPSKRVISVMSEPQVLYLLAEITPRRQPAQKKQDARLNLTLVLDRSKSMRGIRLDKVKIAANQIIDQLSPEDILSVITFSDRADVLIPASTASDKVAMRSMISIMRADGGTEVFHGLQAGFEQNKRHFGPRLVNHIILITDGRTFGDESQCLELAEKAAAKGISISAMGIGDEWNDKFLDALASRTGGTSAYINSPTAVVRFLNERVRSLGNAFAERLQFAVAPDADIDLESLFKLQPTPQPTEVAPQPIPIGVLENNRPMSFLIQLQMPPSPKPGFRTVARLDAAGDVLAANRQAYRVLSDIAVEISDNPPVEEPPLAILDALGKLTLYRMQQKAEEALASGQPAEATRHLENLATRLLASGQTELAQQAIIEARRIAHTSALSEEGRKNLKFGTRMLLAAPEQTDQQEDDA